MKKKHLSIAIATALLSLSGCGGKDVDPASGSKNTPPEFLSLDYAIVDEGLMTTAYSTSARDTDGDTLIYRLQGADAAHFHIDSSSGAISFKSAPNHQTPSDQDTDNLYQITVIASDGSHEITKAITIEVAPVIVNQPPSFVSANTAAMLEGETSTGFSALATDADNDTVSYSLAGADAALLTIDPQSGALAFIQPPSYANPQDEQSDNVYAFDILASDGTETANQSFRLSVEKRNIAPQISSAATVSLEENQLNTGYIATATDANSDPIQFSLTGADAALFEIDASSGVLTFKTAPSYATPADSDANNRYLFTITASDGQLDSSLAVELTVTEFVNIAPVFQSLTTHSMNEGSTATGYTAQATDGNSDTISYSFDASGEDHSLFNINANTGVVSFKAAPDHASPQDANGDNVYHLVIAANDGHESVTLPLALTVNEYVVPVVPALPDTPTNLVATHSRLCDAPVVITWQDGTNTDIGGYRVRRKQEGASSFTNLDDVLPNVQTFTDTTVINDVNYTYMVRPLVAGVATTASNNSDVNTYCTGVAPADPDPIDPTDNGIRKTSSNYFQEENGLVIMEVESTASDLGLWIKKTDNPGYRGTEHFEFTGNDVGSGPATSPLTYTFKITNGGLYRLMIRSRKRLEIDVEPDKSNDCYVKMQGNFSADPLAADAHNAPAQLADLQVNKKLYGGPQTGWGWTENLDMGGEDNKRKPHYVFVSGETYTLTVSGRSKNFNMDRIVFYKMDQYNTNAVDATNPQLKLGTPETVTNTPIGTPSPNN